jgi:Tetratricopeptide repeat
VIWATRRPPLAFLLACLGAACGTVRESQPDLTPARIELSAVAFFPQNKFQCGPAALATVLVAAGVDITPDALVSEVYLPGRHGSLQAELIGSTRRHDRLPYIVAPTTEALLGELVAGHPVLVLQNFGSRHLPIWHFAVVIGHEPERSQFILRSGTKERELVSAARFEATWRRADGWAMIALTPPQLPAGSDSQRYLEAVSGLEAAGHTRAAEQAYWAGLARWPHDPRAWLGLGNIAWAEGRWREAEIAYRELLEKEPNNIAARNNLALALARQGCRDLAGQEIERALALASSTRYAAEVADSAAEIRASTATAVGSPTCQNH